MKLLFVQLNEMIALTIEDDARSYIMRQPPYHAPSDGLLLDAVWVKEPQFNSIDEMWSEMALIVVEGCLRK